MPALVEQKVRIGFDAYGRLVEATRFIDPAGKRMWRIESHPVSQQDDGERMSGLTDDNLRDLIQALEHVRMIEILQFIFQDFWHWLGAVILLCALGNAITATIRALFR